MASSLHIHSEKNFRRFEPYIAEVITNHPEPTIFYPNNVNTFAARFRDALTGLQVNNLLPQLFDKSKCLTIFSKFNQGGDFVVSQLSPTQVFVGPRLPKTVLINQPSQPGTKIEAVVESELDARDNEVFDAIFLLKTRGLLDTPIKFKNVTQQQYDRVSSDLYTEFEEVKPGLYIMI